MARWLKEEYPQLKRDAKREGAQIVWGDEMGLRADRTAGRSYSPRGQTPVIPGTGQRFRCNLISALTNQGALSFMVFRESFTVAVFLRFLRRLIRQQKGRKIYLIVDGHPVHRAKLVQRIERRVPIFPFSREVGKLSTLQRGLALYRLAFGQPQQEDLLAYLDAAGIAGGAMEDGGARISLEPIDEDPPG